MTDKVQKIKDWISKEQDGLMDANGNFEYPEHEGAYHILCNLDAYIDSLQEEPVSKDYRERYKRIAQSEEFKKTYEGMSVGEIMHVEGEKPVSDIDFEQELYKAFGQVKDFTLGMRIAKWFYDMGKNSQEPVSEDLGEYINELSKQFPEVSFAKLSRIAVRVAKWQEEQFEKKRLKHCDELTKEQAQIESNFVTQHLKKNNRTPTFIDAIEYGMKMQKEQMMAKAIDVEVKVDAGGYPYIPQMELYDYDKDVPLAKEGEKYKVVLIKED